ncbi:MAG TPA: GntR family transcriptional regulator [Candidatus Limnocylindrales bacterium]|nr:GntR family transcriptional regulator [Candidatus Limnocylindrales bacterium]
MISRLAPLTDQLSLQERTYQSLRGALLDGEYLPGERIYEAAVAQALGVSRNPVREAVRRLQQDGLLEVRPHYGIYVTSIPADEIEDIYRIRAALEGTASGLAAERMSDAEIAELGGILEDQQRAAERAAALPREPVSVVQADRFHHAIHVGARSPRLLALLEQIYAQVTHFRNLTLRLPGRAAVSAAGHAGIFGAIQSRDSQEAARLMRRHIDDARQALVRQLDEVQAGDHPVAIEPAERPTDGKE